MSDLFSTTAGLWLAVVISGLYHGLNPGMGWPLAVSSALMERRGGALLSALAALTAGHFLAMMAILLPVSAMTALLSYERPLRIAAGLVVIGMGLWLLFNRRHPRFLARIPPTRLVLWSFLVAIVHGAALMLVPIYLGLCGTEDLDAGHRAAAGLMIRNAGLTLGVAVVHTLAMLAAGGALAVAVYRWLGLQFLARSWFDLETLWGLSLVLVGALGLWSAI
ncbi:hypothetical protein QO034_02875 [Sedimentitalea sp. JM2-8]|uniref:Arginine/ornithine antiporter ArcD n=1 Tax=Sedimentitalea xiamensis TaxID=3050037 RepID=A0ABT7FAA8_9RHOB|nr:hypothetical protein [Sedimentitalea xiamensis]MDK3072041.1 hypothetical protein [Sedimentitalea xiamensis]